MKSVVSLSRNLNRSCVQCITNLEIDSIVPSISDSLSLIYLSGIRPIDFLGNFYMTNATEMIFGSMDSDKSVSVELKHDDKLPADSNTYVQVISFFILLNLNIYFK